MSNQNPFALAASDYKRDINVMQHYVGDAAKYLEIMTGKSLDECRAFVIKSIKPGGQLQITDPLVKCMDRPNFEDRTEVEIPLSVYLKDIVKNKDILAPTMTTYVNPSVKKSLQVDFIDVNVKARSKAKHQMFDAQMDGDIVLMEYKKNEQTYAKISNNALSGTYVTASTPLFNKSAHSTLTSTCRCTSGYGNANNEKLLAGNRHYHNIDVLKNNIIAIVNHTDYTDLQAVMVKYNLVYPDVDQVMGVITYSTDLYWRNRKEMVKIRLLIERMSPLQRASFVYTGDLYHLMKFNDDVIRAFITRLSMYVNVRHSDPDSVFKKLPDDYKYLAVQICERINKGIKLKDLIAKPENREAYEITASTGENIYNTIHEYADFIRVFFVTTNVPASMSHFPTSIRRVAVTSDTDSTIFTTQDWVSWFFGELRFGPEANGVAATMIFIASQTIIHLLGMMSGNMGVEKSRMFQIAMKNEYKFDVFITTQVAKHYYALIGCQEGNVLKEYQEEIKGVHLKSSNAPPKINVQARAMMVRIMNEVVAGRKLNLGNLLKEIADVERTIMKSISMGDFDYFRGAQIKDHESYKKAADESPYQHYVFWNTVFGPKYGTVGEPPFGCIKVNIDLENKTAINEWVNGIADEALRARLVAWIEKKNGTFAKTLYLPSQITGSTGIPEEILSIINIRKIVADTTRVFYIILESLGYFVSNTGKKIKLLSDHY